MKVYWVPSMSIPMPPAFQPLISCCMSLNVSQVLWQATTIEMVLCYWILQIQSNNNNYPESEAIQQNVNLIADKDKFLQRKSTKCWMYKWTAPPIAACSKGSKSWSAPSLMAIKRCWQIGFSFSSIDKHPKTDWKLENRQKSFENTQALDFVKSLSKSQKELYTSFTVAAMHQTSDHTLVIFETSGPDPSERSVCEVQRSPL